MAEVFDLAGVLDRLDGDMDLFRELLGIFEEEWPRLSKELESAIEVRDEPKIGLLAHSLKGALGNVGAMAAAESARNLEFAGKEGRIQEAPKLHHEMVAAIEEYRLKLKSGGYLS